MDRRLLQPVIARTARGAVAGVIATVAMSAAMLITRRAGWMSELAPTRVTRRSLARTPSGTPRGTALDVTTGAVHLGIGGGAGAVYALVDRAPGVRRLPTAVRGLVFGTSLWAIAYVGVLPASGLMPAPQDDERRRPLAMLIAHWVYGVTLALLLGQRSPQAPQTSTARPPDPPDPPAAPG